MHRKWQKRQLFLPFLSNSIYLCNVKPQKRNCPFGKRYKIRQRKPAAPNGETADKEGKYTKLKI